MRMLETNHFPIRRSRAAGPGGPGLRASWRIPGLATALVVGTLLAAACGGADEDGTPDSGGPAPVPTAERFTIESDDGSAVLTVTEGALPAGVAAASLRIRAVPDDGPREPDAGALQPLYILEPDGLEFTQPVTLTMDLLLDRVGSAFGLLLLSQQRTEPLPILEALVDPRLNRISVTTTLSHFSTVVAQDGRTRAVVHAPDSVRVDTPFTASVTVSLVERGVSVVVHRSIGAPPSESEQFYSDSDDRLSALRGEGVSGEYSYISATSIDLNRDPVLFCCWWESDELIMLGGDPSGGRTMSWANPSVTILQDFEYPDPGIATLSWTGNVSYDTITARSNAGRSSPGEVGDVVQAQLAIECTSGGFEPDGDTVAGFLPSANAGPANTTNVGIDGSGGGRTPTTDIVAVFAGVFGVDEETLTGLTGGSETPKGKSTDQPPLSCGNSGFAGPASRVVCTEQTFPLFAGEATAIWMQLNETAVAAASCTTAYVVLAGFATDANDVVVEVDAGPKDIRDGASLWWVAQCDQGGTWIFTHFSKSADDPVPTNARVVLVDNWIGFLFGVAYSGTSLRLAACDLPPGVRLGVDGAEPDACDVFPEEGVFSIP